MSAGIGLTGHGEAHGGISADMDSGFGPTAADIQSDQFGAALVDVVLFAIGDDGGRAQDHLDVLIDAGADAAEVVAGGGEGEVSRAFFQKRSHFLADREIEGAAGLFGLRQVFENGLGLAVLGESGGKAFEPGGICDLDRDGRAGADGGQRRGQFQAGAFAGEPEPAENG